MADLLVQVYSDAAGDNHPQSAATISTNREAIGSTQTITATDAVARAQATRERNTRQETTGARTCWHPSHRYRAKSSCPSNRPAVRNSKAG